MGLSDVKLIEFNKISDCRGNLTFLESGQHVPFDIKRVYYLYDVPGGAVRGGHAHKELQQLIISLSGSFDVVLSDNNDDVKYTLNRPYQGLYVPKMLWRELENFSSGSVCMVLASEYFDENDYYRKFEDYKSVMDSYE